MMRKKKTCERSQVLSCKFLLQDCCVFHGDVVCEFTYISEKSCLPKISLLYTFSTLPQRYNYLGFGQKAY